MGLIFGYKMRTIHLLQDVMAAPKMVARGKLKFLPHRIEGHEAVTRIFERSMQQEEQHR